MSDEEGLSPEDEEILDGISHGRIQGQVTIVVKVGMPQADYERLMANPADIEAATRAAFDRAMAELPEGYLASNETLKVEIEVYSTGE